MGDATPLPPGSAPPRDVVAEALDVLSRPVAKGSPERGQRFMALVAGASAKDAAALLGAIARDRTLVGAFSKLANETRTKALVALDRKARGAIGDSASASTATSQPAGGDRGIADPMTSNPMTAQRGSDDPFGTWRPVLPRDAYDDPVAGQSAAPPRHGKSKVPVRKVDKDGWQEILDLSKRIATKELLALAEEMRITPRLVRKFAWGEIQTYLALSLRKARARKDDLLGFDFESEMGVPGLKKAIDTAVGMALLRRKGLNIEHDGITWSDGSLEVDWNVTALPAAPLYAEVKYSRLLTQVARQPPFDVALDFEAVWVIEVIPTAEEIKKRLGQAIYKAQNFFGKHGRPIVQKGRNAVRAAIRRLNLAGRWAGRALFRSAQATGRFAGALGRIIRLAGRALPAALVGLDAVMAEADLLAYIGSINMANDMRRAERWFWEGFIVTYHSLAFDMNRRGALKRAIEQMRSMNTLSGVDLSIRLSEGEVERWTSFGVVTQNKVHLDELDWPVAYGNLHRLYSKASDLPVGGRGAVIRDALEQALEVCGQAAALQELLAFIATRTFDHYESTGPGAKVLERDGFEAWEQLADGYMAYVTELAELKGVAMVADIENAATARLVTPLFRRMNGFPLFPG